MNRNPSLLALVAFIVLGSLVAQSRARAQDVGLELVSNASELRDCPGELVHVTVRLSNPKAREVAGYQIFLSYPTQYLEAVDFEPLALKGQVSWNGRPPFGDGFDLCREGVADPWGDGAGLDVAAVLASAYGDGQSKGVKDKSLDLGRFVFRPKGAATGAEGATLAAVTESCSDVLDQSTLVFGASGAVLETSPTASLKISLQEGGAHVTDFLCQDTDRGVKLSWTGVAEGKAAGFRIFRDSQKIVDSFPSGLSSFEDLNAPPPPAALSYEIVVLKQGFVEGCRTSFLLERKTFIRGDTDGKAGLSVSDAIAILGHLFQGQRVQCEDAADADDSGSVNITDVVTLLRRLFQGLETLPAPHPGAGFDPTPDSLTCQG